MPGMKSEKIIFVYADWMSTEPQLMGRLHVSESRGKEIFSFEYDESWLNKDRGMFFDPDLYLYAGRQYAPMDKNQFGIFSDSSPDRWGRTLMNRREAIRARKEERKPKKLTESDYLLGVYDATRMGALRFSLEEHGDFLSNDTELAAPPWTTLRTLEAASLSFEEGGADSDEEKWLKQLVAPGSSLGGARPKASVEAPDGSLWIAKFPSRHDEENVEAWEMVVHELAAECGLNVPEAKLESFHDRRGTFLVKRFDRDGNQRIHFSSAMNLLGQTDGAVDAGYLDIASFIRSYGASPREDLAELWKRVVFSIAVSNTDDHLRNHGFLLTDSGWKLSPMYDVNPSIYGNLLSLAISREDATMDFDLAIDSAKYYDITSEKARSIVKEIKAVVSEKWKTIAKQCGLDRSAIVRMEPAFAMECK